LGFLSSHGRHLPNLYAYQRKVGSLKQTAVPADGRINQAGEPARSLSSAAAIRPTPSAASAAGTGANESRRLFSPPSIMKSGPATKETPSPFDSASSAFVSVPSARSSQRK